MYNCMYTLKIQFGFNLASLNSTRAIQALNIHAFVKGFLSMWSVLNLVVLSAVFIFVLRPCSSDGERWTAELTETESSVRAVSRPRYFLLTGMVCEQRSRYRPDQLGQLDGSCPL